MRDCPLRVAYLVCFAAAPGVKPVVDFITARTGPDQGSSYMPIACNFCDERLGRVYQTTPQALDHLRGQFTFDTDKITSCVCAPCFDPVAHDTQIRAWNGRR